MSRPGATAASAGPGAGAPMTPDIAAEAAVWLARLHGPGRTRQMELECLAWQGRSPVHREAFERCTETWQDVSGITVANALSAASRAGEAAHGRPLSGRSASMRWAGVLSACVLVVAGLAAIQALREEGVHRTGVGEQQVVVLDDGTRMSLNTGTRVQVAFDARRREVSVASGEALFEVAKEDRARPFVVSVAGSEVVATGTVFAVRLTPDRQSDALSVTLVEGAVTVQPVQGADGSAPARPVLMRPGERLRLERPASPPGMDRPNIDQMLAWRRSEAIFDDAALADAVVEMNRYSRTKVMLVDDSALAQLRVSGLYRTGDSAGFARAVAALHGLHLRETDGRLELTKPQ